MAGRAANPLQQIAPVASQMSTGGSHGTAARARGILASPAHRFSIPNPTNPAGQNSQLDPTASAALPLAAPHTAGFRSTHQPTLQPNVFVAPWSQASQPEFEHPALFASGVESQHPVGGSCFAEPPSHSQPSQTAARLLEEFQGKSAQPVEDNTPILRDILQKLENLESTQHGFSDAIQGFETQLQAQTDSQAPRANALEQQLERVLTILNTLAPSTHVMKQALDLIENAQKRVITSEMATQTSPAVLHQGEAQRKAIVAVRRLPPYTSKQQERSSQQAASALNVSVVAKLGKGALSASTHRGSGSAAAPSERVLDVAVLPIFAALGGQPASGRQQKRPREDDSDEDGDDQISSRLARRVQRHRRAKGQLRGSER